ncbi:glycosyltransferase involved in cell wall biosynthesis [Loktanella sp. PT4BL]|jgi:glycosyltransferase involved in cell wall biosynthesis|uniref:glycosyltransferase family 4 protein n=1 Tax=Loktanella sp. PT4BL TaxID=2135611 RepID=UPI000D75C14A|nr:glycosyltransferase family 4 protein [Loktanella sp. PT4BL]PXW72237.1 glycosyltransferase involved in cell wall biosynthesis [Loktanella sp. PT4BL]
MGKIPFVEALDTDIEPDHPLKIAIYVSSWPPGRVASGIVTYTEQLVSMLRASGHEVYILSPGVHEPDPFTIDLEQIQPSLLLRIWLKLKIRFTSIPAGGVWHAARISAALSQLVREKGVEVLEIEESFGMSLQISQRNIVPVIVRLHGPFFLTGVFDDPDTAMAFNNGRVTREGLAIQAATYITAPSAATLQAVMQHYDLSLENSVAIPNPIIAANEDEIWQIDQCDRNKMLFVGRFDSLKGGDLALETFARLAELNPDLTLTFIGPDHGVQSGSGTLHFEEFFRQKFPEELRKRVDYRGQMSHSDLMAVRTSHYLTLIATQFETMGYMLLEAMSLGCPTVATAVGGIGEVIQTERNGLLVPSQDVDAMVAACQRLLEDPELAARLGRQAWMDCTERYSPEAVATQTVDSYKAAIELFQAKRIY